MNYKLLDNTKRKVFIKSAKSLVENNGDCFFVDCQDCPNKFFYKKDMRYCGSFHILNMAKQFLSFNQREGSKA